MIRRKEWIGCWGNSFSKRVTSSNAVTLTPEERKMPDPENFDETLAPTMSLEEQAMFNQDLNLFFDTLFEKEAKGEITIDQIGNFFPDDVRERARRQSQN